MKSVHNLMKVVSGAVNLRPAWFFDTAEQGEALADVDTHLVDLVPFLLYPGQPIDYRSEIRVLGARKWPTVLDREQLLRLTGDRELDPALASRMKDGRLPYFANGEVSYTLRGTHVRLAALWDYEAPEGAGDTHAAVVRGSLSRVEIRQGLEERWRPELYVVPNRPADAPAVQAALVRRVAEIAKTRPGLTVEDEGSRLRVGIPDRCRVGHEAHFAEVTERFLGYLKDPATLPKWEKANMLAKYWVTTQAVEMSR